MTPPPSHQWWTLFDDGPSHGAPIVRRPPRTPILRAMIAAVTNVVIIATIWSLWPMSSGDGPAHESPANSADDDRLNRILPPGFPPGSCNPTDPHDTLAAVSCVGSEDGSGPISAVFVLTRDGRELETMFREFIVKETRVDCPGRMQSPGPWRRAPDLRPAGMLFCALGDHRATVAWTDAAANLFSVARAAGAGSALDRLYGWWSTHS